MAVYYPVGVRPGIKIDDPYNNDPYDAVVEKIRELTKKDGYECMADRIVRLKVGNRMVNEYLGVSDGEYYWENDWWEGEEEIYISGFIDVDDVIVPMIRVEK